MHITDITPRLSQSMSKIRLAAYCRVSSDSDDQLHSFATQIRYYSEYSKSSNTSSDFAQIFQIRHIFFLYRSDPR